MRSTPLEILARLFTGCEQAGEPVCQALQAISRDLFTGEIVVFVKDGLEPPTPLNHSPPTKWSETPD